MKDQRLRRTFDSETKQRKVEEVGEFRLEGYSISESCSRARISRNQFYLWRKQYERYIGGDAGAMEPKPRRPKHLARLTPEIIRQRIIELARSGKFRSAHAIAQELRREGSRIHTATVIEVLESKKLYGMVFQRNSAGRMVKKRGLITPDR